MCMVSVITGYGQNVPQQQWNQQNWNEFQEVIRRLEALDKKLDQPECHVPAKQEWMDAVEKRLKDLETKKLEPGSLLTKT